MDKSKIENSHPLPTPTRSFTESFLVYVGANAASPSIPMDGSQVTSNVVGLLSTSRDAHPEELVIVVVNSFGWSS